MPNTYIADPILFAIARNIMKSVSPEQVTPDARNTIQNYIAEGLQKITTSVSLSMEYDEIIRVDLNLILPHGYTFKEEEEVDVLQALEIAGVETEKMPRQITLPKKIALNRFSGMNVDEK